MDMNVIRKKSTEELLQNVEELLANIFSLRFKNAIGKLETPHMIKQLRKDIAKIKTELNFRAQNGEIINSKQPKVIDKKIKQKLFDDEISANLKKSQPATTKLKEEKPHDNN